MWRCPASLAASGQNHVSHSGGNPILSGGSMGLYPLKFAPLFRQYIWGGRRLGEVLGKAIGETPRCAESWEVVDRGVDQSVVAEGSYQGRTLGELLREFGADLWASPAAAT